MTSHVLQAPRKVGSRPTWMQAKRSLPDLGGQEVTTASLRIKTPFGTTENHTCWRIVALDVADGFGVWHDRAVLGASSAVRLRVAKKRCTREGIVGSLLWSFPRAAGEAFLPRLVTLFPKDGPPRRST